MSGYRVIEHGKRPLYFEDLYCKRCGKTKVDVYYRSGEAPVCCGKPMRIALMAPRHTDCHEPRYSDASGKYHSSRRDLVNTMKESGFYESGDPQGGARNVLEIKDSSFSYPGQTSRKSSDERRRERKRNRILHHTGRA